MIYVGTCGFSYKDWVGPFYPPKTRPAEMLPVYARRFRAVEIDSSYYGVPTERTVLSMASRTPADFRFSFKAPQTVTHPPDPTAGRVHDDASLLLESIEPMRSAGKLACVLVQFPNALRPDERGREYVRRVIDAFEGVRTVVEFRNGEWQEPATLEMLQAIGASYCNVDMPQLDGLMRPSSDTTGTIGYVRFHGRNAKTWWRGTNVTRYNYFYTTQELVPWADRIAEIEAQAGDTYVFFNNHANGKAAQNAEMLEALLEERYGADAADAIARVAGDADPEQASFDFEVP